MSITVIFQSCAQQTDSTMNYNTLTPEEQRVILQKGTEAPFSGIYTDHKDQGTYLCKQCDAPLFKSDDKFESSCGWPSFDDEIEGAVKKIIDADGRRTEIICSNCGGHLGHVFYGENFTEKDTRYCVNSISLNFEKKTVPAERQKAYFAAGCFWGVEYYMQKAKGVTSASSGYMGGLSESPSYEEVCTGRSGHVETVEVEFDPTLTNYETLAKLFFEIHDFTQVNRQGPDVGTQYRSVIFYTDESQKNTAKNLLLELESKGYSVATSIEPASTFWKAESYHQEYYFKKGGAPYCHSRKLIF